MLSKTQEEKISIYCDKILELNKHINLTAITDKNMFHVKHVVDSLKCMDIQEYEESVEIVDVGTGAGFPAIPLAIASPEKNFLLVDSVAKKLRIIDKLCSDLNITNVKTKHGRVEDIGHDEKYREKYDLCVSRAVARLNILAEWCLPLLKTGGTMIAYKGSKAREELEEANVAIEILGGSNIRIVDYNENKDGITEHAPIIIEKVKNTPLTYPRKPGKAKQEPIK